MRRLGPIVLTVGLSAPALADVVTDGTVGPRVRLGGDFEVGADLGTRAGRNLFHSFERFSLATRERATFSARNEVGIHNVISRVTGGARSDIDGTIRSTIPGADFYFLNPAGVVFGPTASLDVLGSFHVSTADELRFKNGATFSARDTSSSSLSVASPEAFGFLGGRPAKIMVNDSALVAPAEGEALSLVTGNLRIKGGAVVANGILIAAQRAEGSVPVQPEGSPLPRDGRVTLTPGEGGRAFIFSTGPQGGTIRVEGGEITVDHFRLMASNPSNLDSQGGIVVGARSLTVLGQGQGLVTDGTGRGRAGPINVIAPKVRVEAGTLRSAGIEEGSAPAGDVTIRADRVELESRATVGALVPPEVAADVKGGTIKVTADDSLTLGDGSVISTNTAGQGDGGAVVIRAGRLEVLNAGSVTAATRGGGGAGSLDIKTREILVDNGSITAGPDETSTGRAGDIDLTADNIVLRNEGFIGASPFGTSDTGSITIRAREGIEIMSDAAVAALTTSTGRGGTIEIRTPRLHLDEGRINVSTLGSRPAGSIIVRADEVRILSKGQINSSTRAAGNAGSVSVGVGELTILDGGEISSDSTGRGQAGAVTVMASDRLLMERGEISTDSEAAGGGEIQITVKDVIVLRDSVVTTSVQGGQDSTAGNILIDPKVLVIDGSRIEADAGEGNRGGSVRIFADNVLVPEGGLEGLIARGEISASSGDPALSGTVVISAPEVDLSGGLVVLDAAILDVASQLRERCGARRDIGASSFTGVGRGGLPANPDAPLSAVARTVRVAGIDRARTVVASFDRPAPAAAPCLGTP